MNKIRIIDLLNKIANGEEVPEKIKYKGTIYEFFDGELITDYRHYYSKAEDDYDDLSSLFDKNGLGFIHDEVEILDEPKEDKIEKVNTYVLCDSDFYTRYKDGYSLKATEIIDKAFEEYSYKINEIIDRLNNE